MLSFGGTKKIGKTGEIGWLNGKAGNTRWSTFRTAKNISVVIHAFLEKCLPVYPRKFQPHANPRPTNITLSKV